MDVLHQHSKKDPPVKEVLAAFRAHDRHKGGLISAKELRSIMMGVGERLTSRESRLYPVVSSRPRDGLLIDRIDFNDPNHVGYFLSFF